MLALFGLLLSGLGIGYAVHKDNQKFANMRQNYINTHGQIMSLSEKSNIYDKNERMVYNYFEERFNYYLNHYDEVAKKMNFSKETLSLKGLEKEFVLRSNCGYLAYNDIIAKWAPDWYEKFNIMSSPDYNPPCYLLGTQPKVPKQHSYRVIIGVAHGLYAKELHSMGVLTGYQLTTSSPYNIPQMYFGSDNPSHELQVKIDATRADPKWGNMYKDVRYPEDISKLEDAWVEGLESPSPYTCINSGNKPHFKGFVELKKNNKI